MNFKLENQDVGIILQALENLVIPVKESVVVVELIKNINKQQMDLVQEQEQESVQEPVQVPV
jgi:hypothetical protein